MIIAIESCSAAFGVFCCNCCLMLDISYSYVYFVHFSWYHLQNQVIQKYFNDQFVEFLFGRFECWLLQVLLGGMLLATHSYDHPGIYSMEVESPSKPLHGHLVIVCKNRMGKVLRDSIAIKSVFNSDGDKQFLYELRNIFTSDFLIYIFICLVTKLTVVVMILNSYVAVLELFCDH